MTNVYKPTYLRYFRDIVNNDLNLHKLVTMSDDLKEILKRLDSIDEKVNNRFNSLENRFSSLENRITTIDSRLNGIDLRLSNIDNNLGRINTRLSNIEKWIPVANSNIMSKEEEHSG